MTWEVVCILHNGALKVVSEHRSKLAAEIVAGVHDAYVVLSDTSGRIDRHYDVRVKRQKPAEAPKGLAARCKHGEQMLNECPSCELESLREKLRVVEDGVQGRLQLIEEQLMQLRAEQR